MKEIVLSVHGLVDFLLRKGDIDNRIYNSSSMAEGSRIHLRYQQIQNGNYLSEQFLETKIEIDDFIFNISGRADGIIVGGKKPIIDEIKSTVCDLETFYESQKEWHLGQAKVYAYMYCKSNNINECGIKLTYISQKEDNDKLIMNFSYSFEELEEYILFLCKEYLDFYTIIDAHNATKERTSAILEFPYKKYRPGQRELAKYVYGAILNEQSVYLEAPTGIGKTMSTLFPAVKGFSSLGVEKIFYLCAKNVIKDVAFQASKKLLESGLVARTIKLHSKERMCRCNKNGCNPDECPFTIGYYDKIRNIIKEVILTEKMIDENMCNELADKYGVCPFELQLDISLYCDIIICDYNYLFDPMVYLKRFFDVSKTQYVALIDESHNLVDRSRDMYSTIINNVLLKDLKQQFKRFKATKLKKNLRKLITYLDEQKVENTMQITIEGNFDLKLYSLVENLFTSSQDILKNYPEYATELFIDVFRQINRFLKISEYINEAFHLYFEIIDDEVNVVIKCIDSSKLVKNTLSKLLASVFFSATFSPMEYYIPCLGGDEDSPHAILESPFDSNNLLTLVRNDISTKYKNRDSSYQEIALTIKVAIKKKVGNYLVFFSSYQYLENVMSFIEEDEEIIYIKQTREMLEKDRLSFLNNFKENPDKTTVGFAVLGGAFGEGIDLVSDRLIGAIIVGVGLPQISYERDKIKEYFDSIEKNGFDFAYVYPGMNKVMQAAGRVIRSEYDVGFVLFIDERFSYYKYRNLLKNEYRNAKYVNSTKQIEVILDDFWKNH